jgi:glycerol uptake facilitator-like aquaporin
VSWYHLTLCHFFILTFLLVLANYVFKRTDGEHAPIDLGVHVVHPELPVGSGFLAELVGTFLLMWVILMTAVHPSSPAGNLAPMAIGLTVAVANFVIVPWTGSSLNPARTFGPMIIVIMTGRTELKGWWIYYTAPFIGYVHSLLQATVLGH